MGRSWILHVSLLLVLLLGTDRLAYDRRWLHIPSGASFPAASPTPAMGREPSPTPPPTPVPTRTATASPTPSPTPTTTPTPPPITPIAPTAPGAFALPPDRVNLLLLGMDRQGIEGRSRTDTMILVSIDPEEPSARLVSLPRDWWVRLPNGSEHKLNTAYPIGGFEFLRATLRMNLGLSVDRYVAIDFDGMRRLIDALGGVDVLVRCPLYDVFPDPDHPTLTGTLDLRIPGWYHLDGLHALWYMRSRLSTSDYDRSRRQHQVLRAMLRKLKSGDWLWRIPELWPAVQQTVQTNLSLGETVWLAMIGRRLSEDRIAHAYLHVTMVSSRTLYLPPPTTGVTQPLELSILVATDATIPYLRRFLLEPLPDRTQGTPVELINATGSPDRGDIAEDVLAEAGFRVIRRVDLPESDAPTRVMGLRAGDRSAERGRLLRALRLPPGRFEAAPEPDAASPYRVWIGPDFNPCP